MAVKKGFTLVELLLVIGIAAAIFVISAPFSLNFYRTQIAEEARNNVIDALKQARNGAVRQKNDSEFGVTLSEVSSSYVLFQGETYAGRDATQDEIFLINGAADFSGVTDVVFSKLTGLPSATGTIIISVGALTREIMIDDSGRIYKTD